MKKLLWLMCLVIFTGIIGGCQFEVPKKPVEKVELFTPPSKLKYEVGDTIDLTGIIVYAYYDDGSTIEVEDLVPQTTVFQNVGEQEVTIVCTVEGEEYEVIIIVEVKERVPRVTDVKITSYPIKNEYDFLDIIDITGLEVTVYYDDDSTEIVTDYELSVEHFAMVGEVEVFVIVDLQTKYYLPFTVNVREVQMKQLSYISSLGTYQLLDEGAIINNTNYNLVAKTTISNVKYGGFRGENQIVCYDSSNLVSRNVYGFEIAIDKNGIAIDKAVNVSLPEGGFILSGHSAGGNTLSSQISLGDYVVYDKNTQVVSTYNHLAFSTMLKNKLYINELSETINLAYENYLPLDYVKVKEDFDELVYYYNELVTQLTNNINVDIAEANNTLEYMLFNIRTSCVTYQGVENRAFWHYPMSLANYGYGETTKEDVEKLMDFLVVTGFNMVMINTHIGGFSIFDSDYLPRNSVVKSSYNYGEYGNDYLMCFIEEAHKRGIKVVAWTQTLMCGDGYLPNHINKDWVLLNYQGNMVTGVYFYDILNDDVQDFLVNVYTELATKYNLDGLEYDIIRYPVSRLYEHDNAGVISASDVIDSGYTAAGMAKFMERYQLTGDMKQLILQSADVRKKFREFKVEELTKLVGRLSTSIRNARPGIKITAAVISGAASTKRVYMQDWVDWSVKGYVDYLEPMIYTAEDNSSLTTLLATINSVNGTNVLVNSGISPIISNGTHHQTINQINLIHQTMASGFVVFSSRHFFNNYNYIRALSNQKNPPVLTTFASGDEIVKYYIKNMINEITTFYMIADENLDFSKIMDIIVTIDDVESIKAKSLQLSNAITQLSNEKIRNNLLNSLQRVEQFI